MSLIDLQVDLQETNRQLARIADALDRLAPVASVRTTYTDGPTGRKVSPTSPAATYQSWEQEMYQQGRGDEVVAGAYGPRSLKRD